MNADIRLSGERFKDALAFLGQKTGWHGINLGTGYSELEMVKALETASLKVVSYQHFPGRAGDIANCHTRVNEARQKLGQRAKRPLIEKHQSTCNFRSNL